MDSEETRRSLFSRLKDTGCQIDSWQSDLYVPVAPETQAAIEAFEAEGGISNKTTFVSQIDGKRWYDLPFAYQPYWDEKAGSENAEAARAPGA